MFSLSFFFNSFNEASSLSTLWWSSHEWVVYRCRLIYCTKRTKVFSNNLKKTHHIQKLDILPVESKLWMYSCLHDIVRVRARTDWSKEIIEYHRCHLNYVSLNDWSMNVAYRLHFLFELFCCIHIRDFKIAI